VVAPELVVLDVNETLSDLEPLRQRFADVGAPEHLLDTWFAGTLRDGFALAASGSARPFPEVGAAVLTGLLTRVDGLALPVQDAVADVLEGVQELQVHPDVPSGLRVLADAGVRVVTLTNGSLPQSATLLERAGVDGLVERRLSVDDAGRWKPHPDAYRYAADFCGVALERCAMVAVHPWDPTRRRGGRHDDRLDRPARHAVAAGVRLPRGDRSDARRGRTRSARNYAGPRS